MVPFGYERKEYEKQTDNLEQEPQYNRLYLNVIATRTAVGELIPEAFEWEGISYKINKILNCNNGKSLKRELKAQLFYCMCGAQKFRLFFEDGGYGNQKFYIELKNTE